MTSNHGIVALFIFLGALLLVVLPAARHVLSVNLKTLRMPFGVRSVRPFWRRWLANPLAAFGFIVFAVIIIVFWVVSAAQARRAANDTLRTAAADIDDDLRNCVDSLLFFQGDAICHHYGSPEKMTMDELGEIMDRYGLDELNVVDGKGIVIRGALADVGFDMGSNPKSAEFNCLLDGKTKTYSQRFRAPIENPNGIKRKYAGVAFDPPARGYLQLGLSETRLKTRLDYFLSSIADGWHIGDTGFFVIAKELPDDDGVAGKVISTGCEFGEFKTLKEMGIDTAKADESHGETFLMTVGGIHCLCRSGIVNRYHRYVAAIPLSEVFGGTRIMVASASVILLIVLFIVVGFMTSLSEKNESLKTFIAKDHEHRQQDLTLAKTIQVSSLPVVFPDEPDFRIFARMDTAREVGGDFYDFYELPNGEIVFIIADVSGKGVPAALFMMRAKAMLHAAVFEHPGDIAAAVAEANSQLAEKNDAEMFVTAWIGVYNRKSRKVTFVNAGHNPPLVKRVNGSVEWLKARGGLALAAMGGLPYRTGEVQLEPGDSLFLYTDGVTEAMNGSGAQYGEQRLEQALRVNASGKIVSEVRADVTLFVAGAEPSDDITMLALDLKRE